MGRADRWTGGDLFHRTGRQPKSTFGLPSPSRCDIRSISEYQGLGRGGGNVANIGECAAGRTRKARRVRHRHSVCGGLVSEKLGLLDTSSRISLDWPTPHQFPDGSICGFDPRDRTWWSGNSLVALLDLYSGWALRHLHLEAFGRWPGYQSAHCSFERLTEFTLGEYCGCGNHTKLYQDCCRNKDLARKPLPTFFEFWKFCAGRIHRSPPGLVSAFLQNPESPPPELQCLYQDS